MAIQTTSEQRWTAWLARGVARDKKINKLALAVALAVAGLLALWFAVFLSLGWV